MPAIFYADAPVGELSPERAAALALADVVTVTRHLGAALTPLLDRATRMRELRLLMYDSGPAPPAGPAVVDCAVPLRALFVSLVPPAGALLGPRLRAETVVVAEGAALEMSPAAAAAVRRMHFAAGEAGAGPLRLSLPRAETLHFEGACPDLRLDLPMARQVVLRRAGRELAVRFESGTARLRELALENARLENALTEFAALETLRLSYPTALVHVPSLPTVTALSVEGEFQIVPDASGTLRPFSALRALTLARRAAFVNTRLFPNLTTLTCHGDCIVPEGVPGVLILRWFAEGPVPPGFSGVLYLSSGAAVGAAPDMTALLYHARESQVT